MLGIIFMKIGIIQTRGIGDIIIAAPIAMYYIAKGHDVYWPVDERFIKPFSLAFPSINFIGIPISIPLHSADYFYLEPKRILEKIGCDKTFCLYSFLSANFDFGQTALEKRLFESLPFDCYKYAIANVPFSEKWNLKINRDIQREKSLYEKLNISPSEDYVVIHQESAGFKAPINQLLKNYPKVITIEPITDNFFDWIDVLENCKAAFLIDSLYANLVEQLNLPITKTLYLRSPHPFTPIFKNDWRYI